MMLSLRYSYTQTLILFYSYTHILICFILSHTHALICSIYSYPYTHHTLHSYTHKLITNRMGMSSFSMLLQIPSYLVVQTEILPQSHPTLTFLQDRPLTDFNGFQLAPIGLQYVRIYIHTYTYIHTYIHTYVHTYIHTRLTRYTNTENKIVVYVSDVV